MLSPSHMQFVHLSSIINLPLFSRRCCTSINNNQSFSLSVGRLCCCVWCVEPWPRLCSSAYCCIVPPRRLTPHPTPPPPFLSGCRCLVRRFRPSVLCFSPLFVRPGPHLDEDTGINVPRGVGDGATRSPPPWGAGAPQGAFLLLLLYFSHGVGAC